MTTIGNDIAVSSSWCSRRKMVVDIGRCDCPIRGRGSGEGEKIGVGIRETSTPRHRCLMIVLVVLIVIGGSLHRCLGGAMKGPHRWDCLCCSSTSIINYPEGSANSIAKITYRVAIRIRSKTELKHIGTLRL